MRLKIAVILFLALASPGHAEVLGDATLGESVFKRQCSACHQVGPDAINRVGPHLNGVFDRKLGAIEGVRYSAAMQRMGGQGVTWTLEKLDAYLENPKAIVSNTRMAYRGLKDTEQRNAVLAYLRGFSDMPQNIPESQPTARRTVPEGINPAVLELVGDVAYGEYLAQECIICHQRDGSAQGLPSITGWPAEDFVIAMHSYKVNLRDNKVMQMMAQRLADDEIAALAAYFATLD
jgi:cytochrome c